MVPSRTSSQSNPNLFWDRQARLPPPYSVHDWDCVMPQPALWGTFFAPAKSQIPAVQIGTTQLS